MFLESCVKGNILPPNGARSVESAFVGERLRAVEADEAQSRGESSSK